MVQSETTCGRVTTFRENFHIFREGEAFSYNSENIVSPEERKAMVFHLQLRQDIESQKCYLDITCGKTESNLVTFFNNKKTKKGINCA